MPMNGMMQAGPGPEAAMPAGPVGGGGEGAMQLLAAVRQMAQQDPNFVAALMDVLREISAPQGGYNAR